MILTLCFFTFASLVSVDPVKEECFRGTEKDLATATVQCAAINRDPISTCEIQRVGATKYYVRLRQLAGSRDEGSAPVSKKEEV